MANEFVQGDNTFYIRPMDPFKALALLGDLQKTFLPALGAAFGDGDIKSTSANDLMSKNIDLEKALSTISAAINGDGLVLLLQRILDKDFISVSVGTNQAVKLDKAMQMQIYQGNLAGIFELAWEVLKVNYSSFFTPMTTLFGKAQKNTET